MRDHKNWSTKLSNYMAQIMLLSKNLARFMQKQIHAESFT